MVETQAPHRLHPVNGVLGGGGGGDCDGNEGGVGPGLESSPESPAPETLSTDASDATLEAPGPSQ